MTIRSHADFETRSKVDLRKTGADVYAEHPSTDIICLAYALGDDEPRLWTPRDIVPPVDLLDALANGGKLIAHNAYFELVVWNHVARRRYGFPELRPEQVVCTMAIANAHALPGSLLGASTAVGLPGGKDDAGRRAMLKLSRPNRGGIFHEYEDEPETFEILYRTCIKDVVDERALEKRLPALKASEQRLWELDFRINQRGVPIDIDSVDRAIALIEREARERNKELRELTNGAVPAATNPGKIIEWLREVKGLDVHSLTKADVHELLARDDLTPDARTVLEIRQQVGKSSVKKLQAMKACVSEDNRARGLHQFLGARATGRWAGRRIQTQNMPRPEKGIDVNWCFDVLGWDDQEAAFDALMLMHGSVTTPLSSCLRSMIATRPPNRFIVPDYSNIEGRVLPWMAGEEWKLDAFRAIDRGEGKDIYLVAASGIFGEDISDGEDPRRQVGKVSELALGYHGGAGAFASMADVYRLDVDALYDVVRPNADPLHASLAEASWHERGKSSGMTERAWVAAEVVKNAWRSRHPATVSLWAAMEHAAIRAIDRPGEVTRAGDHIKFRRRGSFLFMRLPSGRCLAYPYPKLMRRPMPWKDRDTGKQATKIVMTYFSVIDENRKAKIVPDAGNSGKWARVSTYGGELTENADQAIARDLLAASHERLEAAGYPLVMHVHDENVAELPEGRGDIEEMCAVMSELPPWAAGLPVVAAGWEGRRYRK